MSRTRRPTVLVVGAHPGTGFSMPRYTRLLTDAYRSEGFRTRVVYPPSFVSQRLGRGAAKWVRYVEKLVLFPLSVAVAARRADLVHLADQGEAIALALVPAGKSVVTVHDLLAIRAARGEIADHRPGRLGRLFQSVNLAALRRIGVAACVSATTIADARELIPGARLFLLRNPVDESFGIPTSEADLPDAVRGRRYVVLIGERNWRKQREQALAAWYAAREQVGDLALVSIGRKLEDDEIAKAAELTRTTPATFDEVIQLISIDDALLRAVYAHAAANLQLSPWEGYGWPVVESNLAGTVSICLDRPIYREFGDDNVFVADDPAVVDWKVALAAAAEPRRRDRVRAAAAEATFARFAAALAEGVTTP